MFISVYLFVPETKGRTLEAMDEVFGSAYADRGGAEDLELQRYRREVASQGAMEKKKVEQDAEEGEDAVETILQTRSVEDGIRAIEESKPATGVIGKAVS
jgi:hypothetical protein